MVSVNTAFSDVILAGKHPCVPVCVFSIVTVPSVVRWSHRCCIRTAEIPGRQWRRREQRFPSLPENTQRCSCQLGVSEPRPSDMTHPWSHHQPLYGFNLTFPIGPWRLTPWWQQAQSSVTSLGDIMQLTAMFAIMWWSFLKVFDDLSCI